jgi:hypothetical protein
MLILNLLYQRVNGCSISHPQIRSNIYSWERLLFGIRPLVGYAMDMQEIGRHMIKFEHNSLVLDSSHSKEDQLAVNDFVEYKLKEQEQLLVSKLSGNQEKSS